MVLENDGQYRVGRFYLFELGFFVGFYFIYIYVYIYMFHPAKHFRMK